MKVHDKPLLADFYTDASLSTRLKVDKIPVGAGIQKIREMIFDAAEVVDDGTYALLNGKKGKPLTNRDIHKIFFMGEGTPVVLKKDVDMQVDSESESQSASSKTSESPSTPPSFPTFPKKYILPALVVAALLTFILIRSAYRRMRCLSQIISLNLQTKSLS